MNHTIFNDLISYIDFLRASGYCVMLSSPDRVFAPYSRTLYKYRIHLPPICDFLKNHPCTDGLCVRFKFRFEAMDFPSPFYACCFAGVEEFVYPIHYENKQIMCVHISGFRGKLEKSKRLSEHIALRCGEKFSTLYQDLSTDVPDASCIEALAAPFKYMVPALYVECKESAGLQTSAQLLCQNTLKFIYENYMKDLRCHDIANALGYSESHLRSVFKSETGITLAAQINQIRLERAACLLTTTNLSVTEIAFSCGFENSNYFSTAFHNKYHVSPKDYRKNKLSSSS
ncbi:MAG: helix-turn-helix transcriptional regulator [Lachnospiraceae bacterium]|nr:helix-turn-helix transcriptional regulator [Lachnospiraceae bacterium]